LPPHGLAVTTITSGTSPRPNFSVSSFATLDDSALGSWNPLGESLSATVVPKAPITIINKTAIPMTRRGAAIPSRAIRRSTAVSSLICRQGWEEPG
jgi:hypothetical protein